MSTLAAQQFAQSMRVAAMQRLRPECSFMFSDHTLIHCDGENWPSELEIEAAAEEIKGERAVALLREARTLALQHTDWMVYHAMETGVPLKPALLDWRQALRDLPAATVAELDSEGNLLTQIPALV